MKHIGELFISYIVHVSRNSSTVITATSTQIDITVAALNAFLQLITSAVVAFAIFSGLILINASIALVVMLLFGSAYGFFAISMRRELRKNGSRVSKAYSQQLKALQKDLELFETSCWKEAKLIT